jgi:hypothetical protein
MGEMRHVYGILVGKSEENRLLGSRRRRREVNIRMEFIEIHLEVVDWIHLA